jgi:predicted HicB family RNase H-like nuclease
MSVGLCERVMSKRNDESVRVDSDIARKARVIAADRGVSLAMYLSEILRPVIAEQYAAFIDREAKGKPRR